MKLLFLCKEVPCNNGSAGNIRNLRILEWLAREYEILLCCHQNNYGNNDLKRFSNIKIIVQNGFQSDLPKILKDHKFQKVWIVHNSLGFYIPIIRKNLSCEIIMDSVDLEFKRLQLENEWDETDYDIYKQKKYELNIYKDCDKVITVSDKEALDLKNLGINHVFTIPLFYEMINVDYVAEKRKNCYYIANFKHRPNIRAVKFLAVVSKYLKDIEIHVIGKNPPNDVQYLQSFDNFKLLGPVYGLEKCISQYRLFVAPIFYGAGVNGKIFEAIANKIPSIISIFSASQLDNNLKGIVNIIDDVSPKEWAKVIESSYNNTERLNNFSKNIKSEGIFDYSEFNCRFVDLF